MLTTGNEKMSTQIFTSGSKDMRDGNDVLRCQSCFKMAGPQSRVAGGGFWSQPQAQYSASTHKLLKGISNFNFSSVLYVKVFYLVSNAKNNFLLMQIEINVMDYHGLSFLTKVSFTEWF